MNRNIEVCVNKTPNRKSVCKNNNTRHKFEYERLENANKDKSEKVDLEKEDIKIVDELAIENEDMNIFEEIENPMIEENMNIVVDYNQIEEYTRESNDGYKEKNEKECIEECKDEKFEDSSCSPKKYSGQIYKSRKLILSPPKKDVIVGITNINRDVYVNDIEVLENGISVNVAITISINYGTSKDILMKSEKPKEDEKQEIVILEKDKHPIILTDGPVRNATVIIPCIIYISIPEHKRCSKYRVVNQCLKVSNTQYILDDGSIVCGGIPIGNSLKGIMESYIVSVEVEVI